PGRVAQVAARDLAVRDAQPDEHVAAEAFDEAHAFADAFARFAACGGEGSSDRPGRQARENLPDQREALLHLADAYPDPRIDVARGEERCLEHEPVVWRIAQC